MSKLLDIKGIWDMSYQYDFNEKNSWKGQIILNDDGWFEGIVVDPYSSYQEDRFVFGIYHPKKVIELFKITPISVSSPFVFHGTNDEMGYIGTFETLGLFETTPYGVSKIITNEVKLNDDEIKSNIKELENKIQRYKQCIMDAIGEHFYENSYAIRNSISQKVLRNYEGRVFNDEEIQSINDKMKSDQMSKTKKLVKKYDDDFLFDDEELPFS